MARYDVKSLVKGAKPTFIGERKNISNIDDIKD
jgi:hypothetical protein